MKNLVKPLLITSSLLFSMNCWAADKKLSEVVKSKTQPKGVIESVGDKGKLDRPLFITSLEKGATVTTSPYIGLRSAYDASDLTVNLPSMNEDLVLLQQRKDLEDHAVAEGLSYGDKPIVMLSGMITGQGVTGDGYSNTGNSDININNIEIDVNPIMGTWASGFIALNYDNSRPNSTSGNVGRSTDSRVFVSRGFLTIGNLNESPFYFSLGQMYLQFGRYANSMVTSPLTQSLARSLQRSALMGYSNGNLYGEVYAYGGDTYTHNSRTINEGGLNVGYQNDLGELHYNMGTGFISTMADAQGAINNSNTTSNQFAGFGSTTSTEQLKHRVPGVDLHSELTYGDYGFNAEYISAIRSYDSSNMSFNGAGATPKAMYLEGDYNVTIHNKPTTFALTYGRTWQALAYNLPEQSIAAVASASFWKDTIESIEFRHDINYGAGTTANGNGGTSVMTPDGPSRNSVTAQVGVYF